MIQVKNYLSSVSNFYSPLCKKSALAPSSMQFLGEQFPSKGVEFFTFEAIL